MASQDRRGILTGLVGIWRDVEYMCGLCFVLLDCMNMSTRLQGKVGQDLSTVYRQQGLEARWAPSARRGMTNKRATTVSSRK